MKTLDNSVFTVFLPKSFTSKTGVRSVHHLAKFKSPCKTEFRNSLIARKTFTRFSTFQ